jgi:hypothetical protein
MTPTDTEITVYTALADWQQQHPGHAGIGLLTLHALTGLPGDQLNQALHNLQQRGHITRRGDPWDRYGNRWRPAR